jgi:hypothetical protein
LSRSASVDTRSVATTAPADASCAQPSVSE